MELEFTWGIGSKEKTEKMVKERMNKAETLTPFEQYLQKRREKKKAKREERKNLREQGQDEEDSNSDDSVPSDVDMNDPYFAEEMKNMKAKEKAKKKKKNRPSGKNSSDDEDEIQRKAELELLLLDKDDQDGKRHFDIKKIEEKDTLSKSKKKRLDKKNKKNKTETTVQDDFQVDVADPRFAALYSSHHYNIDPTDPHYRKTKGTEAFIIEKLKRRATTDVKEVKILILPFFFINRF